MKIIIEILLDELEITPEESEQMRNDADMSVSFIAQNFHSKRRKQEISFEVTSRIEN